MSPGGYVVQEGKDSQKNTRNRLHVTVKVTSFLKFTDDCEQDCKSLDKKNHVEFEINTLKIRWKDYF